MDKWGLKSNNLFKPSIKSTSSANKLAEFHSKLISCKRSSNYITIPPWKVFRSQIRGNVSPPRVEKPTFDHYSDIASFRSSSPRANISPTWRSRARPGSILSSCSGKSSPRPSPSVQILRIEELRKAIQVLNEMTDEEFNSLPQKYALEMYEFCQIIKERVKA